LKRLEPKVAKDYVYRRTVVVVLRCSERFYYPPEKVNLDYIDRIIRRRILELQSRGQPQIRVEMIVMGERTVE